MKAAEGSEPIGQQAVSCQKRDRTGEYLIMLVAGTILNTPALTTSGWVKIHANSRPLLYEVFVADPQADLALVNRVLSRDRSALDDFVERATPVIQRRVARWLARQHQSASRNIRQELEDLVQEVFLKLFETDARTLRRWQPDKGLSLDNFIGLVAERVTVSILRGRRHPWREEPWPDDEMPEPAATVAEPDAITESEESLRALLEQLRIALSPQGWRMFELIHIEEKSVAEIQHIAGMSAAAVHQWRSRLRRLACELHAQRDTGPAVKPRGA